MQFLNDLLQAWGNGQTPWAQEQMQRMLGNAMPQQPGQTDASAPGPAFAGANLPRSAPAPMSSPSMAQGGGGSQPRPPQAPMSAPQRPPQADVAQPSLGTYLSGALRGASQASNPVGAILGAASGALSAGEGVDQSNQTYRLLVSKGIDQNTAALAVKAGGQVLQMTLKAAMEQGRPLSEMDQADLALKKAQLSKFAGNPEMDQAELEYKRAQTEHLRQPQERADNPIVRARMAEQYGLDPNSDAGRSYILTGRLPREDQQSLTATDKKEIFKSEDEVPVMESTINALTRAKELNQKAYTGYTAGLRGSLGSKLPDGLVPDFIADPQSAMDTQEFNTIMSMEAIKNMAETLKGATTDSELARFVDILGDPSTPPEIRGRTIDRMLTLAQRKHDIAKSRYQALIDGTYYKPEGGAGSSKPAPSGVGGAPIRAKNAQGVVIEYNGKEWVPVQ